jgi:recombination protein RecT
VADEAEQFEPVWVRPADALARHKAGQFFMIFPTIRTLERMQKFATSTRCWPPARRAAAVDQLPARRPAGRKEARYMEHEMPFGELALVCPDGQIVHHLDWRTDQPVPLLKNVMRLTAPNPGVMTGPGTNSYIVGDPDTGYIVIDPGPDEPSTAAHLARHRRRHPPDRLHALAPDHSPGAKPLQALCETPPPILGLPSAPTARPASAFTPDRELADGECCPCPAAASAHSLKVIHTPGHAANHLCLVLLEDGLLFSGDHILNGSTTVVDPPDGDMTAYLDSLDRLTAACREYGIDFILPAHGYVLGFAKKAIAHLKAHRLQREAKVIAAMRERPGGTLEDWVELAYADVPPRMWPVAQALAAGARAAHRARWLSRSGWPSASRRWCRARAAKPSSSSRAAGCASTAWWSMRPRAASPTTSR